MTMSHGSIPINSSLFDLIYSIFFMEEIFNYHKTMKYNPLFLRKMIRYERVSVLERTMKIQNTNVHQIPLTLFKQQKLLL